MKAPVLLMGIYCVVWLYPAKAQSVVELDLSALTTSEPVPFDEYFFVKGNIENLSSVSITYEDGGSTPPSFTGKPAPNGDFSILFRKLLRPNKASYRFTLKYSRTVSASTIAAIKSSFVSEIHQYIEINKSRITGRGFVNASVVRPFQDAVRNLIRRKGSETIEAAPNSFLDTTQSGSVANQALLRDLFHEVKERQREIKEINQLIEDAGSQFNVKPKLSQLFGTNRFIALRTLKDADLASQVDAILRSTAEAIECIATGGNYASPGLPTDCGSEGIEDNDPTVLNRKAINYSQSIELFSRVKTALLDRERELIAKKDKKGAKENKAAADLADDIIRTMSTLPKRCLNTQKNLLNQQKLVERIAEGLVVSSLNSVVITGAESGDFLVRSGLQMSIDAGGLYAPVIDEIVPYVGANIYFRPIHNRTSFQTLRREYGENKLFWHRFALMVGFSLTKVSTSPRYSTDVFLNRAVIFGAGYRLNQIIRLGIGTMAIKQQNLNSLINDPKTRLTPYISISADLQVVNLFRKEFN